MKHREGYEWTGDERDPDPRHRCRVCGLFFFEEEIANNRYSRKLRKCARCVYKGRVSRGETALHSCFGQYDGDNLLCSQRCGLRQACIVELVDTKAMQWNWVYNPGNKPGSYREYLVRGMRTVGRPMHLREIAIMLENMTNRRYSKISNGRRWRSRLVAYMQVLTQVLPLGNGFYVWAPLWDFDATGMDGAISPTRDAIITKRTNAYLWTPEEILRGKGLGQFHWHKTGNEQED